MSSRTAIVLFTDWVDSTETAVRLGPEAERLRRAHFALLRSALVATGGTEIKTLGDGLLAVFPSAGDAIRCAEAMQRAVDGHNRRAREPMQIRVGISGGDVTFAEDDVFGLPVVEAARLCNAADGGQVLASGVVRALAPATEAWRFSDVGTLDLKGLAGGTPTIQVAWAPSADDEAPPGLPPGIARNLGGPAFVGRAGELGALERAWEAVAAGGRRLLLLTGEPGAGKTRLAAEQSRRAAQDGALVLFGRCDADVRSALRPWTSVFEQLVDACDDRALAAHVAAHGGELARIVPQLASRVRVIDAPRSGEDDVERQRLMDAAVALLAGAAARQPLVIVLDDVNWADHGSVVLLRHLLDAGDVGVLVIATARDSPADQSDAFPALLTAVARSEECEQLSVPGLEGDAVLALVEQVVDDARAPALARALHDETDGNALFTIELLRHLRTSGDLTTALASPARWVAGTATIHDVIAQRVRDLGGDVAPVLGAGAVLGRSFDLDVLAAILETAEEQVLDVLERAVTAALVAETPGRPGHFAFAHPLIQHVLEADLGTARGVLLHRRAADVLSRHHTAPARAPEIARHWRAAAERDRAQALEAALAAGRRALDLLAPDEAADWMEWALHLATSALDPDQREVGEIMLALGDAERRAGLETHRARLLEAAVHAERHGFDDLLVRAALANSRGLHASFLEPDEARIEVLRTALRIAGRHGPGERALLHATLASELFGDREERLAEADKALAALAQTDEPLVRAEVLYRRCLTIAEPGTVQERMALTDELLVLAAELDDPLWQLRAAAERMRVCMEAGEGPEAVAQIERQVQLAPRTGNAMARYIAGTSESLLLAHEGRYAEAEETAQQAAQLGLGVAPDAYAILGGQLLCYSWDQGRLGDLADLAVMAASQPGALDVQRAIAPLALAEAGRMDEAREALAAGAREGLPISVDTLAAAAAVLWSESVARVGVPDGAAGLLERIAGWSEVVAFAGVANFGSVARGCARLAALLGRDDDARAYFATAERLDRGIGAVGPLARTLADHGEWLAACGEDDGGRLAEAAALAAAHGLAGAEA